MCLYPRRYGKNFQVWNLSNPVASASLSIGLLRVILDLQTSPFPKKMSKRSLATLWPAFSVYKRQQPSIEGYIHNWAQKISAFWEESLGSMHHFYSRKKPIVCCNTQNIHGHQLWLKCMAIRTEKCLSVIVKLAYSFIMKEDLHDVFSLWSTLLIPYTQKFLLVKNFAIWPLTS